MKVAIRDPGELRRLDPTHMRVYLAARGWKRVAHPSPAADLWRLGDESEGEEILVPATRTLADYVFRVAEVLRSLERVEGRSQLEILRDVSLIASDVIRLRRPTDDPADAVPLVDGVRLVDHAMSMMAAVASSAVSPRRIVPSRKPAQALDYIRHVRLGHTERGSFVLTIISDVRPLLTPGAPGLLEFMEEPFPRRVTRTLEDALGTLKSAAETALDSGSLESFEQGVEVGISANLCESIAGMLEATKRLDGLAVEIGWSPTLPRTERETGRHTFFQSQAKVLEAAAAKLRESEPTEGLPLTGVVTNLSRQPQARGGTVSVSCVVEGVVRSLAVPLDERDYEKAIEAHRERHGVFFRADIERRGRRYHAANVEGFRLID